jgi:hypothetical protein
MFKRSLIALVITAMLLSACSAAAPAKSVGMRDYANNSAAPQLSVQSDSGGEEKASEGYTTSEMPQEPSSGGAGNQAAVERIVIKNASLEIVVADPAKAMSSISQMAESMGGFVVTSNLMKLTSGSGAEVPEANITVRVPAEKLTSAMDQIKALVMDPESDIRSENVTGQDVTKEYTDLQSRLTNLENARDQLQTILDEAHKTEDVLSVYNQLTSVTEQIEVLKGQIRYYDESSQLSAISVQIVSKASVQPISVAGWEPKGVAREAVQSLVDALQFLANAAIWGVIFCLPIGILIAIPVYLIVWGARKVRRNRKAAKQPESKEQEPPAA